MGRIENSVDWFESNATGAGTAKLPFREVASGMWLQNIQYGTGNESIIGSQVFDVLVAGHPAR